MWGKEIAWRMGIRKFLDNNITINKESFKLL